MLIAFSQTDLINLLYLGAAVLFIFGLKMLTHVKTAARGNQVSSLGMLLAVIVTFLLINQHAHEGQSFFVSLIWIAVGVGIGSVIGTLLALKVPMTGMPQMVALLNGFGGIASLLVACADYMHTQSANIAANAAIIARTQTKLLDILASKAPGTVAVGYSDLSPGPAWHVLVATGLTVLIGGATFTGSLVAFGKLQGLKITPGSPIQFPGQKALIALLLLAGLALTVILVLNHEAGWTLAAGTLLAFILGILLVIGIGGADMPVVVSLLNSYSGLAAAMAGFVLNNQALIITGSLVGASGLILTNIMCKAMNRSLLNVLFGGVGGASAAAKGKDVTGTAREVTPDDVAIQLDAASRVMIVPGYGMAVAQAQHAVAELYALLDERGIQTSFAIHPVAGRMPGHMNVLLAEANVPYEALLDLDASNAEFEQTDVCLIIGANDVTNPAARTDESSPLYGMPILDVDKARSVIVIKRSLNPGFAGIQNSLYFQPNTGMLFGDGKAMAQALLEAMKEE